MSPLSWTLSDGVLEVELRHPPCNEIGTEMLDALEALLPELPKARALLLWSSRKEGFCAGADLRQLYREGLALEPEFRVAKVREFLKRIHAAFGTLDAASIPTVAAVHGVVFGGGFELALTCDLIVADRTARFAFPELRLGIIPCFGGIPRLRRDVSNAFGRDLLFTGRSVNAQRAQQAGLVHQVVAEGEALKAARHAARQAAKFDPTAAAAAKRFLKPLPQAELDREMQVFLELFGRDEVQAALKRFVENEGPMPYLP